MFLIEGALNLILILPLYFTLQANAPNLNAIQYFAITLFTLSLFMESLADKQLTHFLSDPGNKGKVCKKGLWRYSRHPNYFFESMVWLSYCLFAISYNPMAALPYVIMLLLLRFVTGVPPAEASSLKSKPEKFKHYQQETNIFIPWVPKKGIAKERYQ